MKAAWPTTTKSRCECTVPACPGGLFVTGYRQYSEQSLGILGCRRRCYPQFDQITPVSRPDPRNIGGRKYDSTKACFGEQCADKLVDIAPHGQGRP